MKKKDKNLLFILLAAFILRAFLIYTNIDAEVYHIWLSHFIKTGEFVSYDHPPVFFLLSSALIKFFEFIKSFGPKFYWVSLVFIIFIIIDRKLNLTLKIFLILLLSYSWFIAFFFNSFCITSLISLISGLLNVYLTYKLGTFMFNERVGILSAVIMTILPINIIYSAIPLLDSLATSFILLSTLFYLKILESKHFYLRNVLISSVIFALSFYTKYYSVLILPLFFLYSLFEKRIESILPLVLSFLFFLPWLAMIRNYPSYAFVHYKFITFPSSFFLINFLTNLLTPIGFILFIFRR